MKQFFEQYGSVALGILALLVLIAMITPVGNIIKTSLQGTVDTFSTRMNDQTDTMTESMNAAFIDAADFTGAKDGKYYAHGQIVADTTLLNDTNRGTEGWRLTDVQYQTLKNNLGLVLNDDYAIIFHNYDDGSWAWCNAVYIYNINDQTDYYAVESTLKRYTSHPMQIASPSQTVITLKSDVDTTVDGYGGHYNNDPYQLQYYGTANVPKTSVCETLNLGCEVN